MTLYQELKEKAVLLLDPDPWTRDSLTMLFHWNSCRLATCDNAEDGHRAIDSEPFDIVICAHGTPGVDGPAFLEHCRDSHPEAVRIAIGQFAGAQFAGNPDPCGIHAWLQKPLTIESVETVLGEAVRLFGKKTDEAY
jgi:DNA-binding NtrC family response regulator